MGTTSYLSIEKYIIVIISLSARALSTDHLESGSAEESQENMLLYLAPL